MFSCRNNSLASLEQCISYFFERDEQFASNVMVKTHGAKLLLFGCSHFKALSLPLAPSHNASVLSAMVNSSVLK